MTTALLCSSNYNDRSLSYNATQLLEKLNVDVDAMIYLER